MPCIAQRHVKPGCPATEHIDVAIRQPVLRLTLCNKATFTLTQFILLPGFPAGRTYLLSPRSAAAALYLSAAACISLLAYFSCLQLLLVLITASGLLVSSYYRSLPEPEVLSVSACRARRSYLHSTSPDRHLMQPESANLLSSPPANQLSEDSPNSLNSNSAGSGFQQSCQLLASGFWHKFIAHGLSAVDR